MRRQVCDGIGDHLQIRQRPPIAAVLLGQYDKPVESPHDALVLPGPPPVDEPEHSLAAVLQAEKLAEVQFEHLLLPSLISGMNEDSDG